MVEPEQASIAEERFSNYVSAANEYRQRLVPIMMIAANESLSGSRSLNKVIPMTTQKNRGTV
jgi:hypothetical protein